MVDAGNNAVLGIAREYEENKLIGVFNFGDL